MKPPYYAVIFTSKRTEIDENYAQMATKMVHLAQLQEGFLGVESARNTSAHNPEEAQVGITVSYWKDLESIQKWKQQIDHLEAQEKGKNLWYENYTVRIAIIEREYHFESKK